MNLKNTLKSLLKTELRMVSLTTDNKIFLSQKEALKHQNDLENSKNKNRREIEMKQDIAELVCNVLKEKQWGIFFKNEPIQALPVQNNTTLYKVNEVKDEELVSAIELALGGDIAERAREWRQHQTSQNQTSKKLSSGTRMTSDDTKE